MVIIDKAVWQIDGGVPEELVVKHFQIVLTWLKEHDMLTDEGIEEFEDGIDDTASLNDNLISQEGIKFLEECYDEFLRIIAKDQYGKDYSRKELERIYQDYQRKSQ